MSRRRLAAFAGVAVLLGTLTSGAVAAPASANHVEECAMHTGFYLESGTIKAENFYQCPGFPPFNFFVAIDKLVGSSWQRVASGQGVATYRCNGTATNTFRRYTSQPPHQQITRSCG